MSELEYIEVDRRLKRIERALKMRPSPKRKRAKLSDVDKAVLTHLKHFKTKSK